VSFPQDEVDELKRSFTGLSTASEGGTEFILIPALDLPVGCEPAIVDALLCPSERDGYSSRLFLSHRVVHRGPGQNWNPKNAAMILGRHWWAVSWNAKNSNKRLLAILAGHLEAFKCTTE